MSSGTQDRDRVANIARSQPEAALRLARSIADPWFRCQALSYVALYIASPKERAAILSEAFFVAGKLPEPNRVVTVSAWPLKVLALHDASARLQVETERLMAVIAAEQSPVRRADALLFVLGAVIAARRELALRVVRAFASACLQPLQNGKRNRKGQYLLVSCIAAIEQLEPEIAAAFVTQLTPSRAAQAISQITSAKASPVAATIPWPNIGG